MTEMKVPLLVAQSMLSRREAFKYILVWLCSLICGVLFVAFAVHWNGRYIEVLHMTLDQYDVAGQRVITMKQLFDEMFSYGWLLPGLPALYVLLLTPLSDSFSVNGSFWLRLIVKNPMGVAIGRVILSVGFLLFAALCGVLWAWCVHQLQDMPFESLFRMPLGFVGYCALTSGVYLLVMNSLDCRRTSPGTRYGLQAGILLLPVLTYLIWYKLRPLSGIDVSSVRWIPYSVPFISGDRVTVPHSLACLAFGGVFYGVSLCLAYRRSPARIH